MESATPTAIVVAGGDGGGGSGDIPAPWVREAPIMNSARERDGRQGAVEFFRLLERCAA